MTTTTKTPATPLKAAARKAASIQRVRKPGLDAVIVDRDALREFHLTLRPLPGERSTLMLWRLDAFLREYQASIVKHDVFGAIDACEETLGRMKRLLGGLDWPVTWVEGASCKKSPLAGMQVMAVSGVEVEPLVHKGRPIGRVFSDPWARHCLLGDVCPTDLSKPRTDQTSQLYEVIEEVLASIGLVLSDVIRAWLFLDDILAWYGPFNTVRTDIFTQQNLFARGVPVSTGVGARNATGAALVAGAWAVQLLDGPIRLRAVESPLQCAASGYGSCFSRAMELSAPGHRRLLVSGTASIAPDGRTAHQGDIGRQIELTMEVIQAILSSRQMNSSDVSRAVVYFKHPQHASRFTTWCAARKVALPAVVTRCDICREELLFEVEVDAITTGGNGAEPTWEI